MKNIVETYYKELINVTKAVSFKSPISFYLFQEGTIMFRVGAVILPDDMICGIWKGPRINIFYEES